ncbi:MAG: hypothetical protein J0M12_17865 [Deltaproteobacteria bacterium]|nr:hypothetical protein [Deltaproteobacteria bacterium]
MPQLEEWEQRGVIDGFLREDACKQPLLAAACFEFATTETGTPFAVTADGQYVDLEASRAANRRYDQVVIKLFMQETDFPGSVVDVEEGSLQNPDMRRDLTKIRLWLREGLINESEIPGLLSDMRHYRAALLNFSST